MDKKSKLIVAAAVLAALGLLILDGKMGEADCGEGNYSQTTSECREDK